MEQMEPLGYMVILSPAEGESSLLYSSEAPPDMGSFRAPVITDAMWDGLECEEAAPRYLVLQCVGVEHEMCLHGLWPREVGLPGSKPSLQVGAGPSLVVPVAQG